MWFSGLGICLAFFSANILFLARKTENERFAQKNKRFPNSLIFGEQFTHSRSFLVSDSLTVTYFWWAIWLKLTLLFTKEGVSESLVFKNLQKYNFIKIFLSESLIFCERKSNSLRKNRLLFCHEWPEWFAHGHSFLVSDLRKSLMVDHFWWATWAICSQSLFCHEWSEQIAFSRSLKWVILSKRAMS